MHVLVLGGGAIGTSTAFQLARRGADVTLVEGTGIACAASGKSGGFLALDWCDGTPLMALARRSFALHADLAAELGSDWGYRPMTTYAGTVGRGRAVLDRGWTGPDVALGGRIGAAETTAQVIPAAFAAGTMRAAEHAGATLRIGRVNGLLRQGERIAGATVEGDRLEADATVIAMGPWSLLAAQWLPLPGTFGLKGHSLVFETGDALPAEALFLDAREPGGEALSPEVFPRPDGTTYVCAISTQPPLPLHPGDVVPDAGAIGRLKALCGRIAPLFQTAPVRAAGACFRPVTQDGLPLIGAAPGAPGAFVATGHSVWGILNAPATGEAMAELILEGAARTVDLTPFDPARLPPLDPARMAWETVRAERRLP